ncbi:MAG: tetratricopeptide repeat protein, partial [Bacteroidetes bacterium]
TDYSRALEINPNMEMVYNNRGYAYLLNGQYQAALEDVNKAIQLNPQYARAYQTRAAVYQQLGQPAKMQADLQMVQQLQQGR